LPGSVFARQTLTVRALTASNAVHTDGAVALVGVGLIGGSLGLALRARTGIADVRGFDADPAAVSAALDRGAITHGCASLAEAVDGAGTVFVAAPVSRIAELAREALAATGPDCVVSDVGSSKGLVLAALDSRERERFIGGHPICGSERGGVANARADLFVGATYFLTPAPEARPELYERLHATIAATGARPSAIDPDVHDRLMALVSHLPHVLASALIHQAADTAPQGREALRSAGPSFADLTRVAGANPPLWADILLANAEAVREAIAEQIRRLNDVDRAIASGDRTWIREFMERAAAGRARLREAQADVLAEPWRVVVAMPNRPGVISDIATVLGHAHINIEDMALRSGAGEEEGELSLAVSGRDVAERAAALLSTRGYFVRVEEIE
jgi:prephenate dehydrogenase